VIPGQRVHNGRDKCLFEATTGVLVRNIPMISYKRDEMQMIFANGGAARPPSAAKL